MAEILDVEPGPDGNGWWPTRFPCDKAWADDRSTAWRSVTNHPALQAKRTSDILHLRSSHDTSTVYQYQLTEQATYYIAERI